MRQSGGESGEVSDQNAIPATRDEPVGAGALCADFVETALGADGLDAAAVAMVRDRSSSARLTLACDPDHGRRKRAETTERSEQSQQSQQQRQRCRIGNGGASGVVYRDATPIDHAEQSKRGAHRDRWARNRRRLGSAGE
jgi:hypothetical protein